jgi:hypothetical protein
VTAYAPYGKEVRKGYLQTAFERFCLVYPGQRQTGHLRDGYGTFAYVCMGKKNKPYYFCAKKSRNGFDVSCHQQLVVEASRCRMEIYMWVDGIAYRFFAHDILASRPARNTYHGAVMLNFSIRIGVDAKKIGIHRAPASETTPQLFPPEPPAPHQEPAPVD